MARKKAQKLLDDVEAVYDKIAADFSRTRQYFGDEFSSFLPYFRHASTIVDVGCGNGRLGGYLLEQKGFESQVKGYVGVDVSKEMVKVAHENWPQLKFMQGAMHFLPFEEKSVDVVVCLRAFHHLPTAPLRLAALKEMGRVLRPGGTIILSVWNLWQWRFWRHFLMALGRCIISFGSFKIGDLSIPWSDQGDRYYYAFHKRELFRLFAKAGFEIISYTKGNDHIIIATWQ